MVKSYCVKQKKQTECVPNSEKYVVTQNGRNMMKCQCAECGIIKSTFIKSTSTGSGIGKPYCGIKEPPKGRYLGDYEECKNQVRYYGLEAINPHLPEIWEEERKHKAKLKAKAKEKTTKSQNVKKVVSKENMKKMKELDKKNRELNKVIKMLDLN